MIHKLVKLPFTKAPFPDEERLREYLYHVVEEISFEHYLLKVKLEKISFKFAAEFTRTGEFTADQVKVSIEKAASRLGFISTCIIQARCGHFYGSEGLIAMRRYVSDLQVLWIYAQLNIYSSLRGLH